jgi:hypothetical protein
MTRDDQKSEARHGPMTQYAEPQASARAHGSAGEEVRGSERTDQEPETGKVLEQTLRTALHEAAVPQAAAPWLGTLRAELTKRAKARKRTRKS